MTELKTTMDIFKLLDHSNCRDCGEKTCLAFESLYTLVAGFGRMFEKIAGRHGGK